MGILLEHNLLHYRRVIPGLLAVALLGFLLAIQGCALSIQNTGGVAKKVIILLVQRETNWHLPPRLGGWHLTSLWSTLRVIRLASATSGERLYLLISGLPGALLAVPRCQISKRYTKNTRTKAWS